MEKQHLTYFKIENFKRFDSFEMRNLGQFNLIVGDNNVGKTSVLEALLFDEDLIIWRSHLQSTINYREYFGDKVNLEPTDLKGAAIWSLIFKSTEKPITITIEGGISLQMSLSLVSYTDLDNSEKELVREKVINTIPQVWIKKKNNNTTPSSQLLAAYFEDTPIPEDYYIPFIPVNLSYGDDLVAFFYEYLNRNKSLKKELESNLRKFISNLEEVKVDKYSTTHEVFCITLVEDNINYPLIKYGDGTVKVTRILLEILLARSKRLMVDEIGSGIHFTRLKDYWKTVIQLCAKYNVQLFATTHSLECQRAFVEALDDTDMKQYQKDARNITLLENNKGEVKAVTYSFEEFEFSLVNDINTRGGKR